MSLPKKSLITNLLTVVAVTAMLIVSMLLSACSAPYSAPSTNRLPSMPVASAAGAVASAPLFDETVTTTLYEQCIPAVVQIESVSELIARLPFNIKPNQEGLGSGFFIDAEGHILTNNHVIDRAAKVKVVLEDGTKLDATVIGTDKHNDLALLKIDTSKAGTIKYLNLGDSSTVKPGQMSVALGSPYGLQGSITVGVVSGVGRSIPGSADRAMTNIIQTDAAINPGNSGGPLLNSKGEVIGINTAIEYNANGVGFAVPVNTAKTVLPELLKGGAVKTAWLGIQGAPVTKELADKLQLKAEKGIYVINVLSDSPAEKAGLLKGGMDSANEPGPGGDIITAVDGRAVASIQDLISYFNGKRPGDKVTLSVIRGDQQISVPVELTEWPDQLSTRIIQIGPEMGDEGFPNDGWNNKNDDGRGFDFGPFHFRIK